MAISMMQEQRRCGNACALEGKACHLILSPVGGENNYLQFIPSGGLLKDRFPSASWLLP
jgi:hypothetical protein